MATAIFILVFFEIFPLPAWVILGYWFLTEAAENAGPGGTGGVAHMLDSSQIDRRGWWGAPPASILARFSAESAYTSPN